MKNKRNLSITAVILTKDEADMIANCIETLRWCDEVLVIDDDSSDTTAQIAQQLGARVLSFKAEDFAKKREFALKRVKTDWIFYIDADERVTPRLYQEIAVHLETDDTDAISFKRQNIAYGYELHHGGWENDWVTRIFKRSKLKGWQGKIHESPEFEGQVLELHTPLIHLNHRSTQQNLIKSAEWTPMEAQLLYEAEVPPVTLFTLIRKGVMEFLRRGWFQGGHKDGMVGWVEAIVQGINRVLVYIQVWELQQKPSLPERYQRQEQEIAQEWKHHQS